MLSKDQAQIELKKFYPEATIKAWTAFKDIYLFRVEHSSSPFEKDFDPYFSVDPISGEVRDFSVLTDLTSSEFASLKWVNV